MPSHPHSKRTGPAATQLAPLTISRPELLVNGSDREFRRLVDTIFAFAARHDAVRNGHAAHIGLSGIEYSSLIALRHLQNEGDIGVKELADYLHVSGSFITTLIGKFVKNGLVAKRSDSKDKRRVRLTVTKKGHDLLATLAPVQRQVNDVQFGPLSRADFQFLLRVLDQLIESSDKAVALQKYLESPHR
jgi:MarR family transcriptional regulator, organic hydroperoxide resistance regulator